MTFFVIVWLQYEGRCYAISLCCGCVFIAGYVVSSYFVHVLELICMVVMFGCNADCMF